MSIEKMIKVSRINPLVLLLGVAVFFMALYWIAKGVFTLLSWIFPVFLVGALILDYKVVLGYVKWLFSSLKSNPIFGIIAIVLSFIGIPFVSVFLFMRALASRGAGNVIREEDVVKGDYINYEEVELEEDFLQLPEIKKEATKMNNNYNDVF